MGTTDISHLSVLREEWEQPILANGTSVTIEIGSLKQPTVTRFSTLLHLCCTYCRLASNKIEIFAKREKNRAHSLKKTTVEGIILECETIVQETSRPPYQFPIRSKNWNGKLPSSDGSTDGNHPSRVAIRHRKEFGRLHTPLSGIMN